MKAVPTNFDHSTLPRCWMGRGASSWALPEALAWVMPKAPPAETPPVERLESSFWYNHWVSDRVRTARGVFWGIVFIQSHLFYSFNSFFFHYCWIFKKHKSILRIKKYYVHQFWESRATRPKTARNNDPSIFHSMWCFFLRELKAVIIENHGRGRAQHERGIRTSAKTSPQP